MFAKKFINSIYLVNNIMYCTNDLVPINIIPSYGLAAVVAYTDLDRLTSHPPPSPL